MSKLGKKSILIPKESTIKVEGDSLLVSGPKGSQKIAFNQKIFSSKTFRNQWTVYRKPIKTCRKFYKILWTNKVRGPF